jgi:hypothetical protein
MAFPDISFDWKLYFIFLFPTRSSIPILDSTFNNSTKKIATDAADGTYSFKMW